MDKEKVIRYVIEYMDDISSAIAEEFDTDESDYEYAHFCENGIFEIKNLYESEENICRVEAKGSIHVGRIVVDSEDGRRPYDDSGDVKFVFYVILDENGNMDYKFIKNEQGRIDFEEMFIDDYSEA